MNIAHPVTSQIAKVGFGALSSDDIRALSVCRITNSTTLDTLGNPIPGGLYTPELGQFGDNACTTCGLKNPQCPGHPGHIELLVPCYHPSFIDQVLRLLRASCIYCGKLKLKRVLANRYVCKLRLIQYGLIEAVEELDERTVQTGQNSKGIQHADISDEDEDEDGYDGDTKSIVEQNERFVRRAIQTAKRNGSLSDRKSEAVISKRKLLVHEIMANIVKGKKCGNCGAANHGYRKDRAVKIFRKNLTEKDHVANVQAGLKARDPVIEQRRKAQLEKRKKSRRDEDEGVADMHSPSEGEDVDTEDSSEDEPEIAGGTLVEEAAESTTTTGQTTADVRKEEYLNPSRVYAQLKDLFTAETELLSLLYGTDPRNGNGAVSADMFFMHNLLVPPNRYRPENKAGNLVSDAPENATYKNILNACDTLAEIQRELTGKAQPRDSRYRPRTFADFETTWITLQESVNVLIDRNLAGKTGLAAMRMAEGVKQKIEKKEGMFRMNMMGKRVNFAARTVLSPDPNIESNEIGVPPVFAKKLTYPEPVTEWNFEELQEAVRNGPRVWPGAVAIEDGNGLVTNLERKNAMERTALANQLLAPTPGNGRGGRPKKVHRHLNNGDIVIMNRQPTLHKPSMMCHRARVLPGEKTLRMHYANCKTYNADFDGDEMNMHFPQNELARAEALSIADNDHQYLSGTAGEPLRGLIQDHISMCVWLTSRDMFFERGDYMNLLYSALRPEDGHCTTGRLETLPPSILKPKPLWTGKQLISSLLKNLTPFGAQGLTMTGKSSTDSKMWGEVGEKEEGKVIFQDGQHLQGTLDKKQIGPSDGGLINAVYEAYGHTVAGKLLSVLGRMLTRMLHMRAFSCGVEDVILNQNGEKNRRLELAKADAIGSIVAAEYVSLSAKPSKSRDRELERRLEEVVRDDDKQAVLDSAMNAKTRDLSSAVSKACIPDGLSKLFPKNQMQTMTATGAKGSKVNANLISCNLGQQVLEGRRVPVMVSGKTLPCFKPFESNVRAGGYIVDRFLTGIRPQEYFFHTMAGREGLIDTAVKTSRSGYLQRCLVKGMEGLRVEHDTSVRDTADGSIIQFLYGEDGLDVCKSKYLYDFKFAAENHLSLCQTFGFGDEIRNFVSKKAAKHNEKAEKKYRKKGDLGVMDPALSVFPPARFIGSTSERILVESRKWIAENKDRLITDKTKNIEGVITDKVFNNVLNTRYLRSLVEAGEAVGVVAGQSVGEPSTQMTLNTFHLAGHAAKNVTLGIPRLREIVMTAAPNPSTPAMTLRLHDDISVDNAKKFAKGISRLSLAELLDKVVVSESTGKGVAFAEAKLYQIQLHLFQAAEYVEEYAIKINDVADTIEHQLLPQLQALVRKELKKRDGLNRTKKNKGNDDALPDISQPVARVFEQHTARPAADREGGDDDSDDEGDDDATRDKARNNRQQAGYDAFEDDEERDIAARNQEIDMQFEDETYGGSPRPSPEPTGSEADDDDSDDDDDSEASSSREAMKNAAIERLDRIKSNKRSNDVAKFSFDDKTGSSCTFTLEYDSETPKILLLPLVESALRASLVQSVPGITMCMVDEEAMNLEKTKLPPGSAPIPILAASGVNFPALWEYQHIVHPNHLYTNSVHAMLTHYGVEAARATILRELQAVFGGHGISVDPRHLTLIADHQTRAGAYQAFSRIGYRANPSPFMKMSFETTLNFVRDAVIEGDVDLLENPSARIVTGKLGPMGTGSFDVLMPVSAGENDDHDEEEKGGDKLGLGRESDDSDVEMDE